MKQQDRHFKALNKVHLFKSKVNQCCDRAFKTLFVGSARVSAALRDERGDVPGWVLVVLMTTGLVTGIWTLAAPRIDSILRNSLDSMNSVR